MRRVQPGLKFVGVSLAQPGQKPEFFEYFLNPKNHKPGIPLDYISYHHYAVPAPDHTPDVQQYTFFAQADGFLNFVRGVEVIRKRLSPGTGTMINEIGAISADDVVQDQPGHVSKPIPASYWNLAGAMYAYIFGELTRIGIDVAGESQLVGYPTQFPSVSMVDWDAGLPNARYRVLQLLKDNFGPGRQDRGHAVEGLPPFAVRQLRLLPRSAHPRGRQAPAAPREHAGSRLHRRPCPPPREARWTTWTRSRRAAPPASRKVDGETITLGGYAVAVVTLP